MNRTWIIIRRVAISIIILAFIAAACVFSLVRPLFKSDDYTLVARIDGSPVEAQLLKPFPWGPYYIHLDNIHLKRERATRYNWFGVAFGRESVFSPIAIYTSSSGLPYIHVDQAKGVRLTDGKIEDDWTVNFTEDGVSFSNAAIHIQLHQ
jgi:hypothetical protein